MESKVIQIVTKNEGYTALTTVLCEDGSIWASGPATQKKWECVLPPFQGVDPVNEDPRPGE